MSTEIYEFVPILGETQIELIEALHYTERFLLMNDIFTV